MKVVITHYHLRPGGVSGVIRQQVEAISAEMPDAEVVILTGEPNPQFDSLPCEIKVVPELNYFVPENIDQALEYEKAILRAFLDEITSDQLLFHFHNPTLGKNPSLTGAINSLADRRVQIVSTCHDFSEDRPLNQAINALYASWCNVGVDQFLYPDRECITYLTINSADYQREHWAYLKQSRVKVMFPPVQKLPECTHKRGEVACWLELNPRKEWVFYPVRAIKRKNIGEFLLLSCLDEGEHEWILARAPKNELEKPLYNRWVQLAEELHLTVRFDVVETVLFEDLMHSCDRIVTTSVREGFGMAYLEPWYAGKPVAGRELPMVVDDMRGAGVLQDLLYSELPIPVGEDLWEDFGHCSVDEQMDRLRAIAGSSELRKMIRENGNWWKRIWSEPANDVMDTNMRIVEETFSTAAFGRNLKELYTSLLSE